MSPGSELAPRQPGNERAASESQTATRSEHPEGERLQKMMARMGLGSRRVSEGYIDQGRVKVNGTVARLGSRVLPADVIAFDGAVLSTMPDSVTYLLNKPAGVVSTASDPQGRPIVTNLVPPEPRVYPVGRLDKDTEGLLLLSNDGGMTHRLTHPSFGIEKEYLAQVLGDPSRQAQRQLRQGIELDDGMTYPAKVNRVSEGLIEITIHEGRNRQLRRMFDAIGHPVLRLVRTRIGPISDVRLKPGQSRKLSREEVIKLQQTIAEVVSE